MLLIILNCIYKNINIIVFYYKKLKMVYWCSKYILDFVLRKFLMVVVDIKVYWYIYNVNR